jgi:hypothetical protein
MSLSRGSLFFSFLCFFLSSFDISTDLVPFVIGIHLRYLGTRCAILEESFPLAGI